MICQLILHLCISVKALTRYSFTDSSNTPPSNADMYSSTKTGRDLAADIQLQGSAVNHTVGHETSCDEIRITPPPLISRTTIT